MIPFELPKKFSIASCLSFHPNVITHSSLSIIKVFECNQFYVKTSKFDTINFVPTWPADDRKNKLKNANYWHSANTFLPFKFFIVHYLGGGGVINNWEKTAVGEIRGVISKWIASLIRNEFLRWFTRNCFLSVG